jgi:enterochelin esterase family protein
MFRSTILDNERRIWVYTPPVAAANERPGLVVLFDGFVYAQILPTPTILDNLLAAHRLPPLVAVMLESPDRFRELAGSVPFLTFLTEELIPWARQTYHTTADPAKTIVGGASLGGAAAAYAGLRHPDIFGNVLSQSGAFAWHAAEGAEPLGLARDYAAAPRLPLQFYLDVGVLETQAPPWGGPDPLSANRQLRALLAGKGYPVHYSEFSGGHEFICWQGTLAEGLVALGGTDPAAHSR